MVKQWSYNVGPCVMGLIALVKVLGSAWKYLKFSLAFSRHWNPWKNSTFLIRMLKKPQFSIFIHTQRVSVTLAIALCLSSSLSSLLSSARTLLVFRLLHSNRYMDLLQIFCGCSLGGPLISLKKSGCYPYEIMGNFVQFLANSLKKYF